MENKERTSNTGASEARCPFSNPREIFNDFAETRHAEGLTYSEALNAWIVARYDDIVETLHQPNLYSSEATLPQMRSPYREMFEGHVPTRGTLLGLDNPDHDRLRLSVSSFFVPRRLKRLEPLIRREANALIDGFVASGQTNLKASLALPLPLKMITTIVGLDPERFIWVGESLAFFGGHPDLAHGTRDEQAQRLLELHAYISDVIEERRTVRRDDLIWECVAGLLHLRYSLGLNCTPAMKSFSLTPPAVAMKNISHTLTNWTFVIKERLPNLRLAVPYEQLEYLPVSEGRGIKELPVAWDVVPTLMIPKVAENVAPPSAVQTEAKLVVESKSKVAQGVAMLTLRAQDGESLPAWSPGAHIDVGIDEKTYRQYSLCGNPANRGTWQIAVLREPESRGGSIFLHDTVQAGDLLRVRGPRNHFSFQPSRRYIFIAGGIGITPIKTMVAVAAEAGSDWKLIYLGHARSSMAFLDEMRAYGDRVTIWPRNEHPKPFDLSFLSQENPDGLLIYCCGPERLLSAVETACASHPIDVLRVERFAPQSLYDLASVNREIEVVLEKSGIILTVPPDRSILEVVNEVGAGVVSTCQEGTCGTCEVRVLEGEPEHRDSVLTASERAANEFMMICVSRCRGKRLVLDL